jgi:antitoxin MazE
MRIMQVSKWGNSLAVRLPASLVDELKLKAGDDVELLHVDQSGRVLGVSRKLTREEALEGLRRLRGLIPADYKFNREEANER